LVLATTAFAVVAAATGRPSKTRYSGRQFVTALANRFPFRYARASKSRSTSAHTIAAVQSTT